MIFFQPDIHVEVEHDLEDEDLDTSDQKEEDVVRCLCEVFEDCGMMIQVSYRLVNLTYNSVLLYCIDWHHKR